MKKILIIAIAIVALSYGCKNKTENKDAHGSKMYTIGIAKIITHPALDAIEQGIKDELADQGFDNIKYDSQSANGEIATAASIANKFRHDKVDVAVGIATPTALALANQIKDIPVVFSAVTDPISAGLRTTLGAEKGNLAGVSDMPPIKEQMKLITQLKPVKKIGHIYTPSEANSVSQMKLAQEAANELGVELVLSAVTNTSEVKQATEVIAPKVDAIYVSFDNTVVAALSSLTETAYKYNVPVISADPSSASASNVTIAYGIDNYLTGRATGKVIAQILNGTPTDQIPVKLMSEPGELTTVINMDLVERFHLKLTDDMVAK